MSTAVHQTDEITIEEEDEYEDDEEEEEDYEEEVEEGELEEDEDNDEEEEVLEDDDEDYMMEEKECHEEEQREECEEEEENEEEIEEISREIDDILEIGMNRMKSPRKPGQNQFQSIGTSPIGGRKTPMCSSGQQTSMSRFGNWRALISFIEEINQCADVAAAAGAPFLPSVVRYPPQPLPLKETDSKIMPALPPAKVVEEVKVQEVKVVKKVESAAQTDCARESRASKRVTKCDEPRYRKKTSTSKPKVSTVNVGVQTVRTVQKKKVASTSSTPQRKISVNRSTAGPRRSSSMDTFEKTPVHETARRERLQGFGRAVARFTSRNFQTFRDNLPQNIEQLRRLSVDQVNTIKKPGWIRSPLAKVIQEVDAAAEAGELELGHAQQKDPKRDGITGKARLGLQRNGGVLSLRILCAELNFIDDLNNPVLPELVVAITITKNDKKIDKFITRAQPFSSTPKFEQKFVFDGITNCALKVSVRERRTSTILNRHGTLMGEILIDANEVDDNRYIVTWFPLMV